MARALIEELLLRIERENGVKILYACESGSRAWGFDSEDSDFDVRFIYQHDLRWYLSLRPKSDTISFMADNKKLDFVGWDLRKALGLFANSNPQFIEWLMSPIVYREPDSTIKRLVQLMPGFFSPRRAIYHYSHMASGNYRRYIDTSNAVRVKKYLYVVRPVLAVLWIKKYNVAPPMNIDTLLDCLDIEARTLSAINNLVARKRSGEELGLGPRVPVLDRFIEQVLQENNGEDFTDSSPDVSQLDEIFIKAITGGVK